MLPQNITKQICRSQQNSDCTALQIMRIQCNDYTVLQFITSAKKINIIDNNTALYRPPSQFTALSWL